jgi:hypothetical protein
MRNIICWAAMAFLSASLMASDSGVAMARPYGTAWVNGVVVEQSSAIFPGDLVQTNSSSGLKIGSSGSSVTVLANSLVKFEGSAISVERGGVKLATSKSMSAHAGNVTVAPVSNVRTEFEMSDVAGTVQIVALRGDLQISNGSQVTILPQGQQATQKDSSQRATNPLANGIVRNGALVLGAAGASAEAVSRSFDTAAAQSVELAHANGIKTISPVR